MVAMLSKTAAALLALVPASCVELKLALKIDSDADGAPKKVSLRGNRSTTPSEGVTKCSQIKQQRDCWNSQQLYGLKCGGWGGISCIGNESKCEELQGNYACNNAWNQHGLHCIGWAVYGEERKPKCLGFDLDVKQVKSKGDCERIVTNHPKHAKGWSGERCISMTETNCNVIKEPILCRNAAKKGFDCLGWGGSQCLAKGADGSEITEKGICELAKINYNLDVRGWAGDRCITDKNAVCSNIRNKEVCEDAANRLNMQCGGWKDNWCQDPTPKTKDGQELGPQTPRFPAHCNEVLDEILCNSTSARYGMLCGWDAGAASCTTA